MINKSYLCPPPHGTPLIFIHSFLYVLHDYFCSPFNKNTTLLLDMFVTIFLFEIFYILSISKKCIFIRMTCKQTIY